jgi:hypothetical protein
VLTSGVSSVRGNLGCGFLGLGPPSRFQFIIETLHCPALSRPLAPSRFFFLDFAALFLSCLFDVVPLSLHCEDTIVLVVSPQSRVCAVIVAKYTPPQNIVDYTFFFRILRRQGCPEQEIYNTYRIGNKYRTPENPGLYYHRRRQP